MTFDPKRILIILHGSIGDVVRALPLANALRRGFPLARLSWAVEPPSFPLVERHPALDEVILFDRSNLLTGLEPFLRKIRGRRFDLVLDLQRHLKSGVISRWSGAAHRLGFHRLDCKEFNWIFNNHFIPPLGDSIPKLHHYLKFAEYLGIEPYDVRWEINLTPQDLMGVERHLADVRDAFAVLFVGSRWESKQMFPTQIADCSRMITQRFGLQVVWLGGKEDEALAREAENTNGHQAVNLTGRTTLREAAGIIARAKIAVGPDTGLTHLAAALGTPVVSLWGATSPRRNAPHGYDNLIIQGRANCAPCYLKRCPIGRVCMQSIEVEEVAIKIDQAILRDKEESQGHAAQA